MPPKRQPVSALRASGSRHYSQAQLEEREAREIKVPLTASIDPPTYLTSGLADKFRKLSPLLVQMGVLTHLDADGLARYLIAESNYLRATNRLTSAMNAGNSREADRWSAMQDRFFRQCRAAASDLGLTVSSRCSLELPQVFVPDAPSGEERDLFGDDS